MRDYEVFTLELGVIGTIPAHSRKDATAKAKNQWPELRRVPFIVEPA